jgi:hypothetical protein
MLIAFPLQQWLGERASVLCLYVRCLSCLLYLLKRKRYQLAVGVYLVLLVAFKRSNNPSSNFTPLGGQCRRQWTKAYEFCTVIGMSDLLAFRNEVTFMTVVS